MAKWLTKANNDGLSHCACRDALAALPGQADCPWCGCGWMISCGTCRKAFVFATVVETDASHEDIVRSEFLASRRTHHDEADIREAAAWMAEAVADFAVGDRVIYLDGWYFRADQGPLAFDGLFAAHDHPEPPQTAAVRQGRPVTTDLTRVQWWRDRERSDRD